MEKIDKWITLSEYVDIQTGEVITKSMYERMYYKIRSKKTIEIKNQQIKNEIKKYGYIKYTIECRENKQLRLL